jgi:hypothetical protein
MAHLKTLFLMIQHSSYVERRFAYSKYFSTNVYYSILLGSSTSLNRYYSILLGSSTSLNRYSRLLDTYKLAKESLFNALKERCAGAIYEYKSYVPYVPFPYLAFKRRRAGM